ncbi:adenylate/guanylate cyclase domain-containing protein [Anthocerotibacter panamensis]|uniref:adenylate/guanylate cyclase domain-containing protein n=1 Tax=Anthocerotibacter panamensis TaxID=2857077 RepID=UPI001C408629|nr:adenylate/guanylate cyclase domain-containing protein [Anthocerotibacter panamensis]
MADKTQPHGAVALAVLFADISGSTPLYEELGNLVARNVVVRCLAHMTAVIHAHKGVVIKTIGDEIMSTFPTADLAAQAACAMQEGLAQVTTNVTLTPSLRIGFNYGWVIQEPSDVFGDAVNVAARMASLARAGQIITTTQTIVELTPKLREGTRLIDRTRVKGKRDAMDIHELIWKAEGLTILEVPPTRTATGHPSCLKICFGAHCVLLDQEHPTMTMGRDPKNDMVIESELASRLHARIEYRRGKFVLMDQSTNGTFVLTSSGETVHLRREELPLQGTGLISLGRTFQADISEAIRYILSEE